MPITIDTTITLFVAVITTPMAIHVVRMLLDAGFQRCEPVEDWGHYLVRVVQIPLFVVCPAVANWIAAIGLIAGEFDDISVTAAVLGGTVATLCWLTALGQYSKIVEHRGPESDC